MWWLDDPEGGLEEGPKMVERDRSLSEHASDEAEKEAAFELESMNSQLF